MTTRTRRPMIEMSGTVSDLREGDYVDEMGGDGYRKVTVGALVHRVYRREEDSKLTRVMSDELATLLSSLVGPNGLPIAQVNGTAMITNPPAVVVEYLALGKFEFKPEAPVTFRRFADAV